MNNFTIDFDESRKQWRKDKVSLGKGYFKYKCEIDDCNNLLYLYTTQHSKFKLFATDFDIKNKENPSKYKYCEEHLEVI